MSDSLILQVRRAATQKIIFSQHAVDEMLAEDQAITTEEVRCVIFEGEIIEEYQEDARGQSVLILGYGDNRPMHLVCSPKTEYLAIITTYTPSLRKWDPNYRTRRRS